MELGMNWEKLIYSFEGESRVAEKTKQGNEKKTSTRLTKKVKKNDDTNHRTARSQKNL